MSEEKLGFLGNFTETISQNETPTTIEKARTPYRKNTTTLSSNYCSITLPLNDFCGGNSLLRKKLDFRVETSPKREYRPLGATLLSSSVVRKLPRVL